MRRLVLGGLGTAARDHGIARVGEFAEVRLAIELAERILLSPKSFVERVTGRTTTFNIYRDIL